MEPRDFEQLVDAHYQDLYRFALSLAKNVDDACDLTQQTFVIFARKMGDVREEAKVKSWLFTTLYREFIRQGTRSKKVVSMEESDLEAQAAHPEEEGSRAASHSELLDALASLEESQRTILSLFYLEDCSYKTIAEVLNLPIGTVMSRLSRAKDSLRKRLQDGPSTE